MSIRSSFILIGYGYSLTSQMALALKMEMSKKQANRVAEVLLKTTDKIGKSGVYHDVKTAIGDKVEDIAEQVDYLDVIPNFDFEWLLRKSNQLAELLEGDDLDNSVAELSDSDFDSDEDSSEDVPIPQNIKEEQLQNELQTLRERFHTLKLYKNLQLEIQKRKLTEESKKQIQKLKEENKNLKEKVQTQSKKIKSLEQENVESKKAKKLASDKLRDMKKYLGQFFAKKEKTHYRGQWDSVIAKKKKVAHLNGESTEYFKDFFFVQPKMK